MHRVKPSKKFNKSLKKLIKNGLKQSHVDELYKTINLLAGGEKLGIGYRDHKLNGVMEGYRECHIQGDLLLVYQIIQDELVLVLIDLGTHSYLFK